MIGQVNFNITAKPPFWFRPALTVMAVISRMGYKFTEEQVERFCRFAVRHVRVRVA